MDDFIFTSNADTSNSLPPQKAQRIFISFSKCQKEKSNPPRRKIRFYGGLRPRFPSSMETFLPYSRRKTFAVHLVSSRPPINLSSYKIGAYENNLSFNANFIRYPPLSFFQKYKIYIRFWEIEWESDYDSKNMKHSAAEGELRRKHYFPPPLIHPKNHENRCPSQNWSFFFNFDEFRYRYKTMFHLLPIFSKFQ